MNDALPWLTLGAETIGALGSAAAAIVAVTLANRERSARKAAEAETARLRARERAGQASQIIVRVTGLLHE